MKLFLTVLCITGVALAIPSPGQSEGNGVGGKGGSEGKGGKGGKGGIMDDGSGSGSGSEQCSDGLFDVHEDLIPMVNAIKTLKPDCSPGECAGWMLKPVRDEDFKAVFHLLDEVFDETKMVKDEFKSRFLQPEGYSGDKAQLGGDLMAFMEWLGENVDRDYEKFLQYLDGFAVKMVLSGSRDLMDWEDQCGANLDFGDNGMSFGGIGRMLLRLNNMNQWREFASFKAAQILKEKGENFMSYKCVFEGIDTDSSAQEVIYSLVESQNVAEHNAKIIHDALWSAEVKERLNPTLGAIWSVVVADCQSFNFMMQIKATAQAMHAAFDNKREVRSIQSEALNKIALFEHKYHQKK